MTGNFRKRARSLADWGRDVLAVAFVVLMVWMIYQLEMTSCKLEGYQRCFFAAPVDIATMPVALGFIAVATVRIGTDLGGNEDV